MKPKTYIKKVNRRLIIASEGVNYCFKDYFKVDDYTAFHILHQTIPKKNISFYPLKAGIEKMDKVYPIFLIKKLVEAL